MYALAFPSVLLAVLLSADVQTVVEADGKTDYEAKLNELLSKGIAPETNANALLWKALGPNPEGGKGMPAEHFRRLGIPEPAKDGDYFIGLDKFVVNEFKLPREDLSQVWDEQGWASKRPWSAKDYPKIAAWLKANEKPLALVVEGVKRPHYYNPIVATRDEKGQRGMLIGSLLPNVQKCRELTAALTARAMLQVGEGKPELAWQDLIATQRLGRLITHGATLIEYLVGIAISAIAHNATIAYLDSVKLTPQQLAQHMKDLQSLPPRRPIADTIDLGERHMGLDSLQYIRNGTNGAMIGNILPGKQGPEDLKALAMLDWDAALLIVNASYDSMAAAMRMVDRPAREKAFDQLEKDLETRAKEAKKDQEALKKNPAGKDTGKIVAKSIANTLMGLLAPAVRKVMSASDRAEQFDRNLHIAFALAAYRAQNGKYPATLDTLAPVFLPAVPLDLFSGKPLIYKPDEKGYLLYSVGANGKDEGGQWHDDTPPGDDPRVRMPLPPLKKDR